MPCLGGDRAGNVGDLQDGDAVTQVVKEGSLSIRSVGSVWHDGGDGINGNRSRVTAVTRAIIEEVTRAVIQADLRRSLPVWHGRRMVIGAVTQATSESVPPTWTHSRGDDDTGRRHR